MMPMLSRTWLAPLGIVAASACSAASRDGPVTIVADTVITVDEEVLGRPLDIAVDTAGNLIVADMGLHQLVVLDTAGQVSRRIGREGRGPGEFRIPRSLTVSGDTVYLVDALNSRTMAFHLIDGGARTDPAMIGVGNSDVSFNREGDALVARNGRGGALVTRYPSGSQSGVSFGKLRVPESIGWDFGQIKADLTAGRQAEVLRNTSYPVFASDGSAWVMLLVDGTIDRYTATDSLRWTTALNDTLLVRLREGIYQLNRQDTIPGRFVFPSVMTAARIVCSELWVLLREPDSNPATILAVGDDGRVRRRITIEGATAVRSFAVDSTSRRLWLLDPTEGTVLRAPLPEGACVD